MKEQVNILIGRFQPMTKGHLRCMQRAQENLNIPTILCIIETPEEKRNERHPFSTETLLGAYNAILDKSLVREIITVKNADIVKIAERLKDKYIIKSWTCGTDRYESYKTMAEKYKEQAGLDPEFEMIEIERTEDSESATALRKALKKNDRTEFEKMCVPGLERYYHILKKMI